MINLALQRKKKKEVAPWRRDILAHHNRKPSTADRAEFPAKVVQELIKEARGRCQCGCGRPDNETHHVMPRTRGGRGVKTNGMRVNSMCNQRIHANEDELQYWISVYRDRHGENFWFDEQDWEEYFEKQRKAQERLKKRQEHLKQIEPVINLMSFTAGRPISESELRMVSGIDLRHIPVLEKLLRDIAERVPDPHFGYGRFDD